jgi:hypothetical protein
MLDDACGAPIGVQQKLMRDAQVSTTMKYGNAYMTEKRKATRSYCADGSSCTAQRKSGKIGGFCLAWGYVGFLVLSCVTQKQPSVA